MSKTLSVHLAMPPSERGLARLRELLAPDIRLSIGPELPPAPDYEILVAGRPTREQLAASPQLRAFIIPWAGLAPETCAAAREFPAVAVHNLHYNALPVAEMAATLMLTAAKSVLPLDRSMRGNDWSPRYMEVPAILLHGKTALILGYGAIGRHLAPICRGLGMRVLATRRSLEQPLEENGVMVYPPGMLHELLPQSHALLICLPFTDETSSLIGAAELALLPGDAVLVNVGRGAIVEQQALYEALRERRILAAGIDVWYNYPRDEASRTATPPADFSFHELDNIVMSPHRAGALYANENDVLRMEHLAASLNAAQRGDPIPNRVDLDRGY